MNFSETFIRRPIATSLMMAAIALFGVVAYRALPVSDLPTVDFPTIFVGASLPGGDPGTMASAVASPLERQFTTIAGIDTFDGPVDAAAPPMSVTIRLADDIDVSRGNMIVGVDRLPQVAQHVEAWVCWMTDRSRLTPGARYGIKQTTHSARAMVRDVLAHLDVNTLAAAFCGPRFCTRARSGLPDDLSPQVTPAAMNP